MNEQWPEWLFEYDFDGKTWLLNIPARTSQEARERLHRAANFGRLAGELNATITVPEAAAGVTGWCVRAFCWWKNR